MSNSITPIVKSEQYEYQSEVRISKIIVAKIAEKNDYIPYKSNKEILLLIYSTDSRITSNKQVFKMVKKLCAGTQNGVLDSVMFFTIVYIVFILSKGADRAFVLPIVNPSRTLP